MVGYETVISIYYFSVNELTKIIFLPNNDLPLQTVVIGNPCFDTKDWNAVYTLGMGNSAKSY